MPRKADVCEFHQSRHGTMLSPSAVEDKVRLMRPARVKR